MKIAIRADASKNIGIGHIKRTLVLAKGLRSLGHEVEFIVRETLGYQFVINSNFSVIKLNKLSRNIEKVEGYYFGCEEDLDQEIEDLKIKIIEKYDLLIIDSYNINNRYFDDLRQFAHQIGLVDDYPLFDYNVDLIINGNVHAEMSLYTGFGYIKEYILGAQYNLVDSEFAINRVKKSEVKEIMITTGGSDQHNVVGKLIEIIKSERLNEKFEFHVIIGPGFTHANTYIKHVDKGIVFHKNLQTLLEVIKLCDAAISSGGSTLYELCSNGVPTLGFIMAENQKAIVEKLAEKKCILSLGSHKEITSTLIKEKIDYLCDKNNYNKMFDNSTELFDGKNNIRAAQRIVEFVRGKK